MSKNVVIVHYNTPELTEAAIRSLNKVTEGCKVYVFDNSEVRPFKARIHNVEVIDNTHGQLVNFDEMLAGFPDKVQNRSNWGSAKHCKSVDYCFDLFPKGFVLMDSDVLIQRDIWQLFDAGCAWVGGIHTNTLRFGLEIMRVIPYLCWLNVPMLKKSGIRYFNPEKMWFLSSMTPNMYYDTGAWLYEETMKKNLPHRCVVISDYAVHFRHGSWREKDEHNWLEENKKLWQ